MLRRSHRFFHHLALATIVVFVGGLLMAPTVQAQVEQGNVNVTATVYGVPPSTQAVILQPTNGEVFQTTPLVVQGTCGADLLVRVFNNGDLAGSIVCSSGGTFTVNITLNVGSNELTALNYDSQDQPGPDSPAVTVIVEPPIVPEEPEAPPVVVDENGVIVEVPTTSEETTLPDTPIIEEVPLFEDTFIAPLAKLLNTEVFVSSTVKAVFSAALSAIFVTVFFAPVLWVIFLIWTRLF